MGAAVQGHDDKMDDHVDIEIASCLSLDRPLSFFLFAGAGSGKTRSLVNALQYVQKTHESRLRLRGQRVGVITYTNAACDEIKRRFAFRPLFHVATIHSFAWDLISGLDSDIREWLRRNLEEEIDELRDAEAKGRPGTKASITRLSQIESKTGYLNRLDETRSFAYNPNGDNSKKNSLNHAEVIKICAAFLREKPVMQSILINHYPFLLVDESQDTNRHLIDAFLIVEAAHRSRFSLGVIGDTMQRIYGDGKVRIEEEIPPEWRRPEKRINHRCPKRIVRLINRIRSEVDDHVQVPRTDRIEGAVRLFAFPSDTVDKPSVEDSVRAHMASVAEDGEWNDREKCKVLTLEHHMAARRMGFQNIFEPLHSVEEFRTSLLDGSLPATRFFTHNVLPLVTAQKGGDKFVTAKILREVSPLLTVSRLKTAVKPREQLKIARDAVDALMSLWGDCEPSCGAVLESIAASDLFAIPESLKPLLRLRDSASSAHHGDPDKADPLPDTIAAIEKFLDAQFSEVLPFAQYVSNEGPFGTHQGVKGLEFDRVMVLMDDSEARGFMFGYEKLFGAKDRSAADLKNESEGNETSIDRTRRLFYVTCSRTQSSLALIAYSDNPAAIRSHVIANGWFDEGEIVMQL